MSTAELIDSGLAYCTAHEGVIECDGGDGPCDNADTHDFPEYRCEACEGDGRIVNPEDEQEDIDCPDCDGEGITPCTPTPLLYRRSMEIVSGPEPGDIS